MLFGYLTQPEVDPRDDVLAIEAPLECFAFDRPLILADEIHVTGAMVFATTYGFGGMSLVEWALLQTLDSAHHRLGAEDEADNESEHSEVSHPVAEMSVRLAREAALRRETPGETIPPSGGAGTPSRGKR